jgi:hypothetical protein
LDHPARINPLNESGARPNPDGPIASRGRDQMTVSLVASFNEGATSRAVFIMGVGMEGVHIRVTRDIRNSADEVGSVVMRRLGLQTAFGLVKVVAS